MKKPNITPVLYHGTAHRCHGDVILPNYADTGVAAQHALLHARRFAENPEYEPEGEGETFEDHHGDFVCATQSFQEACLYAFKQCDDPSYHPRSRIQHIIGVHRHPMEDGQDVYHAIVAHKDEFLANVAAAEPTIYKLPRVNTFRQVETVTGKGTNEWVSRQPVPLDRCREMKAPSVEEAMKKGMQFFFIDDRIPPERLQGALLGRFNELMPRRDTFATSAEYDAAVNETYMRVLKMAVDDQLLYHYNAEKNICPIDLETGEFITPPEQGFADKVKESDREIG